MTNTIKQCFAIAACTLAISTVQAGDNKTYPGLMGVKTHGSGVPSYSFATVRNTSSSSTLNIEFPVINDINEHITWSQVRVIDRHYGQNVRCTVNQAYWNNTHDQLFGWWGANTYSIGSSNDRQNLNTGAVGGTGLNVHSFVSCSIPPTYLGNASRVISYKINEG